MRASFPAFRTHSLINPHNHPVRLEVELSVLNGTKVWEVNELAWGNVGIEHAPHGIPDDERVAEEGAAWPGQTGHGRELRNDLNIKFGQE